MLFQSKAARADNVLAVWRKAAGPVPDVTRLIFEQLQVTPGGQPTDIQLRGRDLESLKQASLERSEERRAGKERRSRWSPHH